MDKEFQSRGEDDYFEYLPDELVIFIFTKLSNSDSADNNFLEDVKSLGQCSSVSKRFNALTCLVPALSIKHGNIEMLYRYCPEILKKFKHIRSLQVTHWSCMEMRMMCERKRLPIIFWEASYRPHSYCLAVVSCKNISYYNDDPQKQQALMLSDVAAARDDDFCDLTRFHTVHMIYLHHMLVSSIKDHKNLQKVVVTDFYNRGMLTLEEDMLVELRNCTRTNLEQVVARDRSGCVINLDVPFLKKCLGLVMNSVCFNIIEWWEKANDHHNCKDEDADNGGIPSGLPFKCPGGERLKKTLQSILENPDNVDDNEDDNVILEILSDIESYGNLL